MTLLNYVEGVDDVRELTDKVTGSSTGKALFQSVSR